VVIWYVIVVRFYYAFILDLTVSYGSNLELGNAHVSDVLQGDIWVD